MNPNSHTLVIGGTGMLAAVTRRLVEGSSHTTVVARRPHRLSVVSTDNFTPIACDYHDTAQLLAGLRDAARAHNTFDLALLWIHSNANETLHEVLRFLNRQSNPCRVVHVRSSVARSPGHNDDLARLLATARNLEYQQAILGFKREATGSRWLTHEEISSGVLRALSSETAETVVGTVEPWSQRPV